MAWVPKQNSQVKRDVPASAAKPARVEEDKQEAELGRNQATPSQLRINQTVRDELRLSQDIQKELGTNRATQ